MPSYIISKERKVILEGVLDMKEKKKVNLAVVGLVICVLVLGIIIALNAGKVNGIRVTDGPKYQYQVISPDDIIV